jgi:hypothetical protein
MSIDRSIIGKSSPEFTLTVEAGKIKEFAAAIGEDNSAFWDEEQPGGLVAPPTFSHVLRSGKMELLMSDCGLDATRFLHGEHDIVYERSLRPGDVLKYRISIVDVRETAGRRSGPMDIVVMETRVTDPQGELVQTIRQTFVHNH